MYEDLKSKKKLNEKEKKQLIEIAKGIISDKVAYWSEKIGVKYERVSVKCQKTRWGSCSDKGNLNFNCLLLLMPEEVRDGIIVHELCHLKEMNHSKDFYREVYKYYPEYDKCRQWLKNNGGQLISKVY